MSAETKKSIWLLSGLVALSALLFLTGIQWGLPSRASDPFLFGNRTLWTGKEILALAPGWADDANRGADVAAHPLADRNEPIIVNQTDSQRAAIVRRYRLYSDQPDEMITLRALAQMNPGKLQFDPKLYQYGGLWIYPIAATLRGLTPFRLVHLTSDLAFYLDHPEAFGRLYVVMRLYSAAWGIVGVIVMFRLATRISQSQLIGAMAAICYMLLPTVINGAHEAKPHLAGAVLGLIAIDFAVRAIETPKASLAIATGIACGAAASMVLSGWLLLGILPVMASCILWHGRLADDLPALSRNMGEPPMPQSNISSPGGISRLITLFLVPCATALVTYAACNPYVIIHLLGDRTILESNLGNSAAMYQAPASIDGIMHGILLLVEGGSTSIFFGLLAIVFFAWRKKPLAWILLAATLPALCVYLARAAGKPGEYGRFALPIDVLWILAAAMGLGLFARTVERAVAGLVLCMMLLPFSLSYLLAYQRETSGEPTRLSVAGLLQSDKPLTLAIDAEPAPYALPPVDLFAWKLILLPRGASMPDDADLRIDPVDQPRADQSQVHFFTRPPLLPTPISWAAKPFRVEVRGDVAPAARRQP